MQQKPIFNVNSCAVVHDRYVKLVLADGRVIVLTCDGLLDAEKVAAANIRGVEIRHI